MRILPLSLKPLLQSKLLWGGLLWLAVFPSVYDVLPVRIDMTMDKSLAYSVWLTKAPFDSKLDSYAMFKPTVHNRYTHKVGYFVKQIGCREGQRLNVGESGDFYCDGKHIAKAKSTDKDGNPVDFFHYNGVIPENNFFMLGTHERSYDSRYFGLIRNNQIERGAKPLW